MTVKEILTPVILQEFNKYENLGHEIKLKSKKTRRIKYSVICGIIALFGLIDPILLLADAVVYIILMVKTKDNINLILSLAKKSPDKPIDQIIAEEMNVPYNNTSAVNIHTQAVNNTFCPICGFCIKQGASFCGQCGYKL